MVLVSCLLDLQEDPPPPHLRVPLSPYLPPPTPPSMTLQERGFLFLPLAPPVQRTYNDILLCSTGSPIRQGKSAWPERWFTSGIELPVSMQRSGMCAPRRHP